MTAWDRGYSRYLTLRLQSAITCSPVRSVQDSNSLAPQNRSCEFFERSSFLHTEPFKACQAPSRDLEMQFSSLVPRTGRIPTLRASGNVRLYGRSQLDRIVWRVDQILFRAEVTFVRLYRSMAQ